jgi:hypothetical protein
MPDVERGDPARRRRSGRRGAGGGAGGRARARRARARVGRAAHLAEARWAGAPPRAGGLGLRRARARVGRAAHPTAARWVGRGVGGPTWRAVCHRSRSRAPPRCRSRRPQTRRRSAATIGRVPVREVGAPVAPARGNVTGDAVGIGSGAGRRPVASGDQAVGRSQYGGRHAGTAGGGSMARAAVRRKRWQGAYLVRSTSRVRRIAANTLRSRP